MRCSYEKMYNEYMISQRIREDNKLRLQLAYSSFACKSSWILITSLDLLKVFLENFMHFKKFNIFFFATHFYEISRICKYVKSCICPLGLYYEIRESAYLSPRGIASKFKNAISCNQNCNHVYFFTKFFF